MLLKFNTFQTLVFGSFSKSFRIVYNNGENLLVCSWFIFSIKNFLPRLLRVLITYKKNARRTSFRMVHNTNWNIFSCGFLFNTEIFSTPNKVESFYKTIYLWYFKKFTKHWFELLFRRDFFFCLLEINRTSWVILLVVYLTSDEFILRKQRPLIRPPPARPTLSLFL